MQYFFHNSIKNYTIALLDMFSDIHVPRFNSGGEKIEDIVIPIKFGNRDKAYMLSEHDIENLHSGNVNTLPRMVLAFDSMSKAPDRDTNKLSKINKRKVGNDPASLLYEYHYNAVAYDFNFNIYVACRSFTDATIVVEQIAPMFRPDITLKIMEMDIQEKATSVPVTLGDFGITLPEDPAEDEIRIIEIEFPLVLKGNLYLPIKDSEVIKEIELNISIIESERNKKGVAYEVENDASVIKTVSTIQPLHADGIPKAQEAADVSKKVFENSGEIFKDNK